ncbi:MAG: alpha/beta fold hydrolase [Paracoccaceae bacterium]
MGTHGQTQGNERGPLDASNERWALDAPNGAAAGPGPVPGRWLGARDRAAPVVFLHGYLGSPALWERPEAGRPGLALALPGHHPWSLDRGAVLPWLDLDRLASAYAGTIARAFGGRPAVLVGHSTGGLVALQIALRHPSVVDSVLLVGALGSGDLDGRPNRLGRAVAAPVLGPAVGRAVLGLWLASGWTFRRGLASAMGRRSPGRPASEAMRADLRASDAEALRRFGLWLMGLDVTAGLDALAVPVRWLIGRDDPVVPPAHQLRVLRLLPRADAVVLDAGHLPMVEAPDAFDAALDAWIAVRRWRGLIAPEPPRAGLYGRAAATGGGLHPLPGVVSPRAALRT